MADDRCAKKRCVSPFSSDDDDSFDDPDYDLSVGSNSSSSDDNSDEDTSDSSTDSYSSGDEVPLSAHSRGPLWRKQDLMPQDNPASIEPDDFFGFPAWDIPATRPSYYQYFDQFFSANILAYLTDQTNLYITRKQHGDNPPKKSKASEPVTGTEMRKFIGCLLYMSLVHMPKKERYFLGPLRQEMVASRLKFKRFCAILHHLHLADTSVADTLKPGEVGYDNIAKIRPFLQMMTTAFKENGGDSERCQAIDEQMVKYKGRAPTSLKMYMPAKPVKWGYKMWTRAGVSGYVYDLAVAGAGAPPKLTSRSTRRSRECAGSNDSPDSAQVLAAQLDLPPDLVRKCGLSGQVVLSLSQGLPKDTVLYYDNYFASYALAVALGKLGYYCIFTLREARMANCPLRSEKELKATGAGSYDYSLDIVNNVLVCAWYDRKRVLVGSNFAGVSPVGKVKRWDRAKKQHVEIERPNIIDVYNKSMGGVDTLDMLVSLYSINFRSKKWYIRIFYRLLDISVVNAWILYRRHQHRIDEPHLPLYEFKLELAKDLLSAAVPAQGELNQAADQPGPSKGVYRKAKHVSLESRYDGQNHRVNIVEKQQRCKLCKKKTYILCSKCNLPLCIVAASGGGKAEARNCFDSFHYHSQ